MLTQLIGEIRFQCVSYFKLTWEEFNTGITRDLRISEKILDRYPVKGSEKRKAEVIHEFKKEYIYDINKLISVLTYNNNK